MKITVPEIISDPKKIFLIDDGNDFSRVFKLSFGYGLLAVFVWQIGVAVAFRRGVDFFLANMLFCASAFIFFSVLYLPAIHVLASGKDTPLPDVRRLISYVNFSATPLFFMLPFFIALKYLVSHAGAAAIFFLLSLSAVLYLALAIIKILRCRYRKGVFQALGIALLPCAVIVVFFFLAGVFVYVLYKGASGFAW